MADRPHLVGYAQPWSLRAGDRLEVMLSADSPVRARASIVRLGALRAGEVLEHEVIEVGTIGVLPQLTQLGSCVLVPGAAQPWPPGAFVAATLCMPTRLGRRQALIAQAGGSARWWLGLDEEGRPTAEAEGVPARLVTARLEDPLVEGAWYLVAASFDPGAGIVVAASLLRPGPSWRAEPTSSFRSGRATTLGALPLTGLLDGPLALAAAPDAGGGWGDCFDGKLEAPCLLSGNLEEAVTERLAAGDVPVERLLARWVLGPESQRAGSVACVGAPGCEGHPRNTPLAGVTGHSWDGSEIDFRIAPEQYAALHFHSDDLDDCCWEPTVTLELPPSLPSGVYALRAEDEAERRPVERVPFFVGPPPAGGAARADLLVLIPTASYLAYANDHPVSDGDFSEATAGRVPVLFEDDLLLHEHREWGLSMYDSHLDGSGVAISSARRPLLNMRPTHRYHVGPWQLPADLAVLSWLDDAEIAYDVATDEDLHREGAELLAGYRVLVTGTHPEYDSTPMLDALEGWARAGGRLVYLGANGFYWRVAFDQLRPYVMELRRGQSGSRAWESAPGESRLAYSGEPGGLWRHLGRPPQKLTGVGYAAQGFDVCGWYRRLPASADPRAAWIFAGVEGETFGTSGTIGGGAVGQELDRCDSTLGSPADALVLATSEGLSEAYQRCAEEVQFTLPGLSALVDPAVRADVVYHVKPAGGAVFATGSIAWAGALGVDAGIDRITRNVLERFLDPEPLPW
jgi:N,N-dimethylformamidase